MSKNNFSRLAENTIIVGDGSWGTAIGSLLKKNKRKFSYWKINTPLPDKSILIFCIPTQVIRPVLEKYGRDLKEIIYINGAKGIEEKTHKVPYEIATDFLGKDLEYYSLIGPSFAGGLKKEMPTLVNLGFVKNGNAENVCNLFRTNYFRIRTTNSVRRLELSSAFKNVYAIACGLAEGLGFETNTRIKLVLLAIEEQNRLFRKLKYLLDDRALPGTVGDLILTCSSEESRNFSFGKLLVRHKCAEALEKIGETVEGFSTVSSVPYFEKKSKLPLAGFVYQIIKSDNPLKIKAKFKDFVSGV